MHKYYSSEEKQVILEEFKQSGLSKAKFSRLKNVSESSLYKWSKEIEQSLSLEEGSFIPMQINITENNATNNKTFSLNLPNNMILEFPCGFDIDYFSRLLKGLMK